jgi:glycosyltransferase involved in cell wall biosynthesis
LAEKLYVVVPCYNEREVLPETAKRLGEKLRALVSGGKISPESRVLFVDDGSADGTWEIISDLHEKDKLFSGLKLSRNKGHQNALLAGLMSAMERADISISMDADLQDDVDVIDGFLEHRAKGCDIVYGVRDNRRTDTAFKRLTAQGFYKLMKGLGADIVYNHADCRLMSRRALQGLSQFEESNLFLRGIIPMIGYKTAISTYQRQSRLAGESKYPFKKMLSFAFDGITSFSVKPLRLIRNIGIFIVISSLLFSLYSLLSGIFSFSFAGWGPLMGSLWFLSGLNLAALGMVGEYTGKIYAETKKRPRYIVEDILD